nr:discoidin domain-containing protein [Armatimonadota bacterium]
MKSTRFALISSITALILAAQLAPALAYEYVRCDTARETWRASLSAEGNGPEFGRWYYIGPFDSPEGRGFDAEYPPEKAIDLQASYEGKGGRTVRWQLGTRFRDGQENSLRIFGDDDWIAVYLYRTITAPEAQELPVLLGSDDSIIVWLNGERLLAHNVGRACTLGDERLTLRLNKGENQLLLKVCNGAGPSGFAFAVDQGPDTLIQRIARDFPLEINDLLVELDWIRQARQKKPTPGASVSVDDDAPGAVDGVKDGGTGFHTQLEEKPWWQVDLGREYVLHRALLYNREDAGSRNNVLMMLLSSDGENWRQVWQNQGV